MSAVAGLPTSPTASVLLDVLQLMSRPEPPAIRWAARIQPQPQRRPRADAHVHKDPRDAQYEADLQLLWRAAKLVKRPLEGELFAAMAFAGCTTLGATKTRAPRADRTNLEKAIEDAGNGLLWRDDRQIVQGFSVIHAWGPDVRPFVSLEVWQLEEANR